MALDYLARHQLVNDTKFTNRLQMALWIAASDVLNEEPGTTNHTARVAWAKKELKGVADPEKMKLVAIRVSANPSVGAAGNAAPDSDIQFVVNGLIDGLT